MHQFLRRQPFVVKVILLIALSGIPVGVITDHLADQMVSNMFKNHLANMLEWQSQEDRLRFDHYLKDFRQVARLTAEHRPFLDYVKNSKWLTTVDSDKIFRGKRPV